MPHYEFFCHACKKFFDKILSLVDYEEGEVRCPHCGGKNVEQRWSAFSVITSKKSAQSVGGEAWIPPVLTIPQSQSGKSAGSILERKSQSR